MEKELVFPTHTSFHLSVIPRHNYREDETRFYLPSLSHGKQKHRALSVLPFFSFVLLFVILTVCGYRLTGNEKIRSGHLVRKLAEGGKDGDEPLDSSPPICQSVDTLTGTGQGEAGDASGIGSEPTPTFAASHAGEEGAEQAPRGRKRKRELLVRWLQESGDVSGKSTS